MKEVFRHEIPAASEKPETRVLEARALFDMYKRDAATESTKLQVPDLIRLSEAFKGNTSFEKDREWIRSQIMTQFDNQSSEGRLSIIEHLASDDPDTAKQLLEKI